MALRRDGDKAKAWANKRTPLPRGKSLDRGAGLTIDRDRYPKDCQVRGSTLHQRSPELAAYYRTVRAPLVAELTAENGCEAPVLFAIAGLDDPLPGCAGPLDVHERLRRGQGGSLEIPANLLVLCRAHNGAAACCARGDAWHQAGVVVFEGDDGWRLLLAPRGERKQR